MELGSIVGTRFLQKWFWTIFGKFLGEDVRGNNRIFEKHYEHKMQTKLKRMLFMFD